VLEDGRDVRVHRLIVGKPRTPTPQFATKADAVILNPDWVVPASIQKEGIAQMVARNPSAARAKGYVRTPTGITQLPGPANQLGAMKLRMPNPYGVYIHDTPAKSLFARQKRALSHGCMRVESPLVLADALLGAASPGMEALYARVKTARTETLPLPAPVPLWVVYLTAVPGPEPGAVRLLPDVYGRDAAVAEALRGRPRAAVAGAPLVSSECSEAQAA
jgi:murein L,D-transpeptidase YcbB/YkuD